MQLQYTAQSSLRNISDKMQVNDTERPQRIQKTESVNMKRKRNDAAEYTLSEQTAHGNPTTARDGQKAVISAYKSFRSDISAELGTCLSPPTRHTRVGNLEALFGRSHSFDDSTIQSIMSYERVPKATIIHDRYVWPTSKIHY